MTTTSPDDRDKQALERTIFFSDAVIAIALTLLALELRVPTADEEHTVWQSFSHNFNEEYISFLISFAVIGAFWFSHHRFFQDVARISPGLIPLNLLSLLAIVLVPFATKVLTANNNDAFGPMFYASTMVLFGVAWVLMVVTAQRKKLWRPETPPTAAGNKIFGLSSALGLFALSIPLALISVDAAKISWLATPIVAAGLPMLRARIRARRSTTTPAPHTTAV